jgi:hypothetical protein
MTILTQTVQLIVTIACSVFLFVSPNSFGATNASTLFDEAESFWWAGNVSNAVPLYQSFINTFPDSPYLEIAVIRLVDTMICDRKYTLAQTLLNEHDTGGGTHADAFLWRHILINDALHNTNKVAQLSSEMLLYYPEGNYITNIITILQKDKGYIAAFEVETKWDGSRQHDQCIRVRNQILKVLVPSPGIKGEGSGVTNKTVIQ